VVAELGERVVQQMEAQAEEAYADDMGAWHRAGDSHYSVHRLSSTLPLVYRVERGRHAGTVAIGGNTYPVKEQLKAIGGRWDGDARCWRVPAAKAAEARAMVAAAPPSPPRERGVRRRQGNGLPHGQLWQPCIRRGCREEPVCVNCELCEYHCGCEGDPSRVGGGPIEPYGHGARGIIDP
jgi:hypothetical protein